MVNVFNIIEKNIKESISVIDVTSFQNASLFFKSNFKVYYLKCSKNLYLIIPFNNNILIEMLVKAALAYKDNKKNVLVYLSDSKKSNKLYLKENNINYVSSDGDINLNLNTTYEDIIELYKKYVKVSYTKKTQLLIGFYLLNPIKEYKDEEIATKLGMSKSSVSRSNSFLLEIDAIKKIGNNTGSKYMIKSKRDLFNKTKSYFINPIKRKINVLSTINKFKTKSISYLYCGETSFSKYTNIENNDDVIEIAINSKEFNKIIETYKSETKINKNIRVFSINEFIYDPHYLSSDDHISIFDAYIIMKQKYLHTDDERIKNALKEIESKLING